MESLMNCCIAYFGHITVIFQFALKLNHFDRDLAVFISSEN